MTAVGRNDRCPCGSGRKHKRCCLGAEAAALRLADRLEGRIDELGEQVRQEHWSAWLAAFEANIGPLPRPGVVQADDVAWLDAWLVCHAPVDTLTALHAAGGKIPRAWAMKEMVRAIFAPGLTVDGVDELIDRLLARLSRSRLTPFVRLGRTIRKHRDGILAARRLKLSNARAEALNNKAKLITRRAYGFHSANAALALIHLTCGPITLTLPHEQTA